MAAKTESSVNSIKKIFEIKKKRSLPDAANATMHRSLTLNEFIKIENPYAVFVDFNRIIVPKEEELNKEYPKLPENFREMCEDLKLLNKKDVGTIIRWRGKVIESEPKENRHDNESESEEESDENEEEEAIKHEE